MEKKASPSVKNEIIGCMISVSSMTFFTLGSVAVQALNGYIPDFELNVIRLSGRCNCDTDRS